VGRQSSKLKGLNVEALMRIWVIYKLKAESSRLKAQGKTIAPD
jgi:hypothetical protein